MKMTKSFLANSRGSVATLFAIAAVPLLLAAGSAIDFIRAMQAETALQAALDSTVMAIALSDKKLMADREQAGKDYFLRNFEGTSAIDGLTIKIEAGLVRASAQYDYPTSFLKLGGIDTLKIGGLSEVALSADKKAEVVLVLDFSYSMVTNNKYLRMRTAATDMLNALDASAEPGLLTVGLVPFSAMVRATMPASFVTQSSAGATWSGCTQDRHYPYNTGVETPGSGAESKWGYIEDAYENRSPYDCAKYAANSLDIVPLSEDIPEVVSALSRMEPVGNTNIPLATEFGWNLLDPAAPFTEASEYADDNNRKFIVILTDGVQTSKQWGSGDSRSVSNGNDNLLEICAAMRAKEITVFAIAYDITNPAVTSLLKTCAPGNYFEPDAAKADIDAVFRAITRRIKRSTLRLAR